MDWAEVKDRLGQKLVDLGYRPHPEYPFLRLQHDQIWEVSGFQDTKRNRTVRELNHKNPVGKLSASFKQRLLKNPEGVDAMAEEILATYFEKAQWQDLKEWSGLKASAGSTDRVLTTPPLPPSLPRRLFPEISKLTETFIRTNEAKSERMGRIRQYLLHHGSDELKRHVEDISWPSHFRGFLTKEGAQQFSLKGRDVSLKRREKAASPLSELPKAAQDASLDAPKPAPKEVPSKAPVTNKTSAVFQSRFLSKDKVESLLNILKQENARSLFLSCLPGDFKRSRVKLDLAHIDQNSGETTLIEKLLTGSTFHIDLDQFDFDDSLVLQKKFKSLLDQSQTEEKERGTNPLKVGYPIVVQEARQGTSNCFAAPMFIWDVRLEKGARNTWRLGFEKSLPTRNHSLEGITQGEYQVTNLDLTPLYNEVEEIADFSEFSEGFQARIAEFLNANPSVVPTASQVNSPLELIPFGKKGDLIDSEAAPLRLSMLHSAMLGKFQQGKVSIIRDLEAQLEEMGDLSPGGIDLTQLGGNASDPAQAAALNALREPQHIVLHGPPGTGKSQTITSMLTAALARKKRVAVVCQKMVALEVIERNLNDLGIRDGIAFITDPIKSRRTIVDAARARYDTQPSLSPESASISEKENKYTALSKNIVAQKKRLSESLNASDMTFADCVGELAKIQRSVSREELSVFLNKHPEPRQIQAWQIKGATLLDDVYDLKKRHEGIAPHLQLQRFFNEDVLEVQLGLEIPVLCQELRQACELKNKVQESRHAIRAQTDVALSGIQAEINEIQRLKDWLSQRRPGAKALESIFADCLDAPIQSLPSRLLQKVDDLEVLAREKSRLVGHPDFVSVVQYPDWKAWFKRNFSSRAQKLIKEHEQFQLALDEHGVHQEDNISDLASRLGGLVQELESHIATFRESALDDSSSVIMLESRSKTKKQELESFDPEKHEATTPQGLEPLKSAFAQSLSAFHQQLKKLKEGRSWIRFESLESLVDNSDLEAIDSLEKNLGMVATTMQWLKDINELSLNVHDFELEALPQWVNFHLVKQAVNRWNKVSELPMNNSDIDQMERATGELGRSVTAAARKLLDVQFQEGAERILAHDTVYTFAQEFAKTGKRKKSLRQLYQRHGRNMTKLFPIHLLTPESMCNLFEAQDHVFDLVIFDEASQLKLEDGVSCLLKGNSIVVSGDEHQMPPSSYFATKRNVEDESDESDIGPEIDSESLLDFCRQLKGFRSKYLEFHYRSKHPLLIQFSNAAIYSRLVVKPNRHDYIPIRFVDVQGTWENRHNDAEAKELIEILQGLNIGRDVPSILVATLNTDQRNHILTTIEKEREVNAEFARRMAQYEDAGFGVKNLENLQGDECDIVMLSVGYGKSPDGRFRKNYGPINQKHGYRLLNVLVTRARHKIFVLNSIPMEETIMFQHELGAGSSSWSRGLFHAYLNYARFISLDKRNEALRVLSQLRQFNLEHRENHVPAEVEEAFDSPFEEEVYFALRERFDESEIRSQEKALGFRMDFVIHPKEKPGVKIAVECDGASYHEGWENQLSDFHREELLKSSGYEFVRIWSRNWWSDAKGETRKLIHAIDGLIARAGRISPHVHGFLDDSNLTESFEDHSPELTSIEDLNIDEVPKQEEVSNETNQVSEISQDEDALALVEEIDELVVVAPCMVTVSFPRTEGRTHRFVILESRGTSFLGRSRDEWMKDKSRDLTVWGDEHPDFRNFIRRRIGDAFTFKNSPVEITDIAFED